jgi:hypothetical protein
MLKPVLMIKRKKYLIDIGKKEKTKIKIKSKK